MRARDAVLTAVTLVAGFVIALMLRGGTAIVDLAVLCLLFIPLEKRFAFRRQRVFRPHLATDLTHFFVDNFLVTIGGIVRGVLFALPLV